MANPHDYLRRLALKRVGGGKVVGVSKNMHTRPVSDSAMHPTTVPVGATQNFNQRTGKDFATVVRGGKEFHVYNNGHVVPMGRYKPRKIV